MFLSLPMRSKSSKGQALVEYLIMSIVVALSAGAAAQILGKAMSRYFSFLVGFISLPIP